MPLFYHKPLIYPAFSLLMFLSAFTFAGESEKAVPSPGPPPLPEQSEVIEPDIRIIQRGEKLIEEYRLNGKLYQIKVTPRIGPSYYMVDIDGDGDFDSRFEGPVNSDMLIPSWVLFRW